MEQDTQDEQSDRIDFSKYGYGKPFQRKVMQALIVDHTWAAQMIDVMRTSYFELRELQFLSDTYFGYHKKYKCFPSFEGFIALTRDELAAANDDTLRERVVSFLQEIRTNPEVSDLPWVKEKSLDFCRKQEIRESLTRIVDKIEGSAYDGIVEDLKRAVSRGACESIGHDFLDDREQRFAVIRRTPIPTGIRSLDAPSVFAGGLGNGELGVVIAATGSGKSHVLVSFGAYALSQGYNVNHYTFELSESAIGIRYDSNLTQIPSNEVPLRKNDVLTLEDQLDLGRLIIKGYPTGSATVQTLRAHVERTTLEGRRPDVLLVDYADIMRSSRHYDAPRFELKLIYEELRSLAVELGIPIWTASQSNRESANTEIVGLESMAEAYGKAFIADVVVSLSRRAHEKATGVGRLFVAKNRAGRDGLVFPIHINTATSTIDVVEGGDVGMTMLEAQADDTRNGKDALRRKLSELRASHV